MKSGDQVFSHRNSNCLSTTLRAQLAISITQMKTDGAFANTKKIGDLMGSLTCRRLFKALQFTRA